MPSKATVASIWAVWPLFCIFMVLTMISFAEEGYCTWYSIASATKEGTYTKYNGLTANGEKFNENAFTCARRSHEFGGLYQVCTTDGHIRCVVVRHNDFGVSRKYYNRGVVIDLTPHAFQQLAPLKRGRIRVVVMELSHNSHGGQ